MQTFNSEEFQSLPMVGLGQPQVNPTILVVDDDLAIRLMLETVLEEEGYNVILADNGQEALKCLKKQRPALILLDLMMPIMNGWEFLETIKQVPEFQNLPVLLLSASREISSTAHQNDIKGYLPKPFELDKLLYYIERYAPRP